MRFQNLLGGRGAEQEMTREMESHLGLLAEEFERRGMSPEQARLEARRAYGGVEHAKNLHRDTRSFPWVEQFLKDLRCGARNLLRTPAFTAIAALTLALGIGANTAIFSVVNAVLLQPLGYENPERLVTLLHGGSGPVSPANYIDWRDGARSMETMAAAEAWGGNLTGAEQPEHVNGIRLTQNYLPMMGVSPMLGRWFAPGEDQAGSEHEVILTYQMWQRLFNGDAGWLGKPITLNGNAYTVIGVMPPGFQFTPFWAMRAELAAPLAFGDKLHSREGQSLRIFGRLKPGVTLAQARAEIAAITAGLE